jgi:hypothetical protein
MRAAALTISSSVARDGNPKAIEETFPVLAPTLAHVVDTLGGRSVH